MTDRQKVITIDNQSWDIVVNKYGTAGSLHDQLAQIDLDALYKKVTTLNNTADYANGYIGGSLANMKARLTQVWSGGAADLAAQIIDKMIEACNKIQTNAAETASGLKMGADAFAKAKQDMSFYSRAGADLSNINSGLGVSGGLATVMSWPFSSGPNPGQNFDEQMKPIFNELVKGLTDSVHAMPSQLAMPVPLQDGSSALGAGPGGMGPGGGIGPGGMGPGGMGPGGSLSPGGGGLGSVDSLGHAGLAPGGIGSSGYSPGGAGTSGLGSGGLGSSGHGSGGLGSSGYGSGGLGSSGYGSGLGSSTHGTGGLGSSGHGAGIDSGSQLAGLGGGAGDFGLGGGGLGGGGLGGGSLGGGGLGGGSLGAGGGGLGAADGVSAASGLRGAGSGGGVGAGGVGAGGRGAGMGMMPMMGGGQGGNGQDRQRTTWLAEDEDVWGGDDAPPGVIA